jgi:hypothetical protein
MLKTFPALISRLWRMLDAALPGSQQPGETPPKLTSLVKSRWFTWGWLAALFLLGAVAWAYFFSLGRFPFTFHDWADITGPRLAITQDAINKGVLPLQAANSHPLHHITDQFMAIPDQILSPQLLLLPFMSLGQFTLVDILLLYACGFLGLLWLRRRFSLSPLPFTILFVLFNFNGYNLAHLSVGHLSFDGYFLLPWFAVLVFQLIDGQRGWGWITRMALLLFVIYLQGFFHAYIWCLIFLAFLALTKRGYFWTVVGGATFAILISMVRILPSAIIQNSFTAENFGGYPSLVQLWDAMVTIYPTGIKVFWQGMNTSLGYWEFSLYTGLIGAAFLLFFGIWRWLQREWKGPYYHELLLPISGLVILSIGVVFELVRKLPIPLIQGERVSSRIIIIPFLFILIFAVVEFQRWLEQPHRHLSRLYILVGGAAMVGLHDLWQNFLVWRVWKAASTFKPATFTPQTWLAANYYDLGYSLRLGIGLGVSVLTLALLLFLTWRAHHRRRQAV